VELLSGPFRDARERDALYLLELDPDRMLHNFRVNAGLQPKAPVYGGWESLEPWRRLHCHGHTLGHWLTAASLLYAATRDDRFRERIDYIVDELGACQGASGSGLVCAFPDGAEQLERAVRGEEFEGVPWYTLHKVFAGIRDAYVHAGNEAALAALVELTDWAWDATDPMTDQAFQRMLDREHGGMNEVLADVHALTGEPRHLTLARRFCHQALLEPLAQGRDILDGLHSNTQIPKFVGFARLFELTGEPELLAAARFFWETVALERSFVTGGHGDLERFFPPEESLEHLRSAKTMEGCCTYNMLRLTRLLFGIEPSATYADFYERALYNNILASQDPDTGWNTYFQTTRPGYMKLYHSPIDSFWCCTGTGMENHAKHGDSIYFKGTDDLWVNLFIASQATWEEKGITIRQETSFPEGETVRLTVRAGRPVHATLNIRHPSWTEGATVAVNGSRVERPSTPGSFIALTREWSDGDVVHVHLAMGVHTEALPGAPNRVSFLYGPIVLAGRLGQEGLYPGADILRAVEISGTLLDMPMDVPALAGEPETVDAHVSPVVGAEPLTFETVGIGRPRDVELVPYYRLHHERYNLYWEVEDGV
jgi:DUF1680 family protein